MPILLFRSPRKTAAVRSVRERMESLSKNALKKIEKQKQIEAKKARKAKEKADADTAKAAAA